MSLLASKNIQKLDITSEQLQGTNENLGKTSLSKSVTENSKSSKLTKEKVSPSNATGTSDMPNNPP
jgi:hypothetical protein